jgi:Galactose oxidase-like, Early set domain/Carboxypeptidase regulatory-like domain
MGGGTLNMRLILTTALLALPLPQAQAQVSPAPPVAPIGPGQRDALLTGSVTDAAGGSPIANARVTLFRPDLSFFMEARSDNLGDYDLGAVPPGVYRFGIAARGWAYVEQALTLVSGPNTAGAVLQPESEPGQWDVIGSTLPQLFDASDIGFLLPDGSLFFCHDTTDPVLFDPLTGLKSFPPPSGSEQGCMNGTLLADGSLLLAGGQAGSDPGNFVNGIPWVKRFTPPDQWQDLPDMVHSAGRWYTGLARLADGSVLVMGGGQSPDASRTETCERLDLGTLTWSYTGSLANPLEFPSSVLLYDGTVLQSWGGQPERYDPVSGSWSLTGNFVFPQRGWPGHSDHSLLVLTDGRALAVGVNPVAQPSGQMTETYDPNTGTWTLGTSPDLRRLQAEVVYLPDGQVFVGGGDKGFQGGPEPDVLGIVRRCDLLDPVANTWRRVTDSPNYREYHALSLLLHDGRIAVTGGTRIKFQVGPTTGDVDAYVPPYLFRGVRPQLANLSETTPSRGATVEVDVLPDTRLTSVVLMGMPSTTHWVDGGIPRRLELVVTQASARASFDLPTDPNLLPLGWYLLFGMVDDIPSVALSLRIDP